MSILIKGALLDGAVTDVYIEKKEIRQVGTDFQVQADQVIDGRRKALIPGFVNAHTHAAMTLFRGFGFIKCCSVGRGIILPPQEEHLHRPQVS